MSGSILASASPSAASPAARAWRRLARSRSAWIGVTVVSLFVGLAFGADWIAPYSADAKDTIATAPQPPSSAHWLGTDALQKDVLSRVMFGSRLSLVAGVISILLAASIGTPLGAAAGYFGGLVDSFVMRGIDVALAFP